MSDTHDELAEKRALCEFFAGKPISQDVLTEYCNKNGIEPIGIETYEDLKYAYERDNRREGMFPAVLAEVMKLRIGREIDGKANDAEIKAHNEAIEEEIAHLCEVHGITYDELSRVMTDFTETIAHAIKSAEQRVSNMAALQLNKLAEEKFGSPLTIRAFGEYQRGGKPFHKAGDEPVKEA